MVFSRRALILSILAVASPLLGRARQGLDQFGGSEPPCGPEQKVTPAVTPDGTFRPGSPRRSSLVEAAASGSRTTVSGTVTGLKCGRIKDAVVDVWQADSQGRLAPSGFALRGHQITDATGHYRFSTIVPGAGSGRAPHLSFRVQVPAKIEFWTEAFFPGNPANPRDARFKPELAMKKTVDGYVFDVFLDL